MPTLPSQEGGIKGSCKTKSITYTSTCTVCTGLGRTTQYIGESGRSIFERSREHLRQAKTKNTKSHIREHLEAQHPGVTPEPWVFRFSITGSYRSALDRQLSEAIQISRASGNNETILNSKLEFNRCLIPTLATEDLRPKPYQTSQVRLDRDPDDEDDDYWADEDDNPNKRSRNQKLRRENQVPPPP